MFTRSGTYNVPRADVGDALREYLYDPENFIATKVLPWLPVPLYTATYPVVKRGDILRRVNTRRAFRSAFSRSHVQLADQTYKCEEEGHEHPIDDRERDIYQGEFAADLVASESALFKIILELEYAVASAMIDTTTFTTANGTRTVVGTAWTNVAAGIIADVEAARNTVRQRTGMEPNTLIISAAAYSTQIHNNTGIRDSIRYTSIPTRDQILAQLSALTGLEKILIAKAVQNTANEGAATNSVSDIWSSTRAIVCVTCDEGAPINRPCIGRSPIWTSAGSDIVVEQYREEQTTSDVFRARVFKDHIIHDNAYAQVLNTNAAA